MDFLSYYWANSTSASSTQTNVNSGRRRINSEPAAETVLGFDHDRQMETDDISAVSSLLHDPLPPSYTSSLDSGTEKKRSLLKDDAASESLVVGRQRLVSESDLYGDRPLYVDVSKDGGGPSSSGQGVVTKHNISSSPSSTKLLLGQRLRSRPRRVSVSSDQLLSSHLVPSSQHNLLGEDLQNSGCFDCTLEGCDSILSSEKQRSTKFGTKTVVGHHYDCVDCGKNFCSKFQLSRHVKIHSGERGFRCSVCDQAFYRKDHLKTHEKTHLSPSEKTFYECDWPECNRTYNSYSSYAKHRKSSCHQQQSPHVRSGGAGDEGSKKGASHSAHHRRSGASNGKGEVSVATALGVEKRFQCGQCQKRFPTSKDLKRHDVVHTGNREFQCSFCSHRFGRKDHRMRHEKKTHATELGKASVTSSPSSSSSSPSTTSTATAISSNSISSLPSATSRRSLLPDFTSRSNKTLDFTPDLPLLSPSSPSTSAAAGISSPHPHLTDSSRLSDRSDGSFLFLDNSGNFSAIDLTNSNCSSSLEPQQHCIQQQQQQKRWRHVSLPSAFHRVRLSSVSSENGGGLEVPPPPSHEYTTSSPFSLSDSLLMESSSPVASRRESGDEPADDYIRQLVGVCGPLQSQPVEQESNGGRGKEVKQEVEAEEDESGCFQKVLLELCSPSGDENLTHLEMESSVKKEVADADEDLLEDNKSWFWQQQQQRGVVGGGGGGGVCDGNKDLDWILSGGLFASGKDVVPAQMSPSHASSPLTEWQDTKTTACFSTVNDVIDNRTSYRQTISATTTTSLSQSVQEVEEGMTGIQHRYGCSLESPSVETLFDAMVAPSVATDGTSIATQTSCSCAPKKIAGDLFTQTKNPVLPSVYIDNSLIVPDLSKHKYHSPRNSFLFESDNDFMDVDSILRGSNCSAGDGKEISESIFNM